MSQTTEKKELINTETLQVDKVEYTKKLLEIYHRHSNNTVLMTREKYEKFVKQMQAIKLHGRKTPADYSRAKKYAIIATPDGERLAKIWPNTNKRSLVVTIDEIYDIVRECHLKLNHGGRSRMSIALKRKYWNITTESLILYSSMCMLCKKKLVVRNKSKRKESVSNETEVNSDSFGEEKNDDPLDEIAYESVQESNQTNTQQQKHRELFNRGQVDLLNVTSDPNEEYMFMLIYRDFSTKFIHLKAMKSLCVEEAVEILLDIFLVFGAPNILQSKNGLEVVKPICRLLSTQCPNIKVVTSESIFSHKDFEGKSNSNILEKLNNWLANTENTKWQNGIKHVQHSLNTTFHEVLCRSPNELVFGSNPRRGLASFMSKPCYEDLFTETDLITALDEGDMEQKKPIRLEESLVMPRDFIKLEIDSMDEEKVEDDDD